VVTGGETGGIEAARQALEVGGELAETKAMRDLDEGEQEGTELCRWSSIRMAATKLFL